MLSGALPLGWVSVLLQPAGAPAIVLLGLAIRMSAASS